MDTKDVSLWLVGFYEERAVEPAFLFTELRHALHSVKISWANAEVKAHVVELKQSNCTHAIMLGDKQIGYIQHVHFTNIHDAPTHL